MIVRKDAPVVNDRNPLSPSALRRKDMRRGRQVLVYDITKGGVIMDATIVSSPYDHGPKLPDRNHGMKVLVQNNDFNQTHEHSLVDLGVVPDESGQWNTNRYLLDTNRYSSRQLREDGSDLLDPPDRS